MTQKEFEELSSSQVEKLNGKQENSDVVTAWRAGYIYAQSVIKKSFQEDYQDDFLEKTEAFIDGELDEFETC